eukprot:NODE_192_length_15450_cov_0.476355.p6 type:complete len:219 gc:universal NODE_192_length_15450_cov_0.476355:2782-3438(+)
MKQNVLVIGGNGQLGQTVVDEFIVDNYVISIDFSANSKASESIVLNDVLTDKIIEKLPSLNAVICVAGGWAGGSITSNDVLASVDRMYKMNSLSAALAGHIASLKLVNNGLLVLFGAEVGKSPTPGMIGYGMSKAATHHLVQSLANDPKFPGKVICLLPITLDTPSNRKYMGDMDTSTWTPMPIIAKQVNEWYKSNSVQTGQFYTLKTLSGKTSFVLN